MPGAGSASGGRATWGTGSGCSNREPAGPGWFQVENEVPQPHVLLAFGFSNLNPAAVVPTT
jgi:hypothetical protein